MMKIGIDFFCASHVGLCRSINQDNFYCAKVRNKRYSNNIGPFEGYVGLLRPELFCIFDGIGGLPCGEQASYIAACVASQYRGKRDCAQYWDVFCQKICKKITVYAQKNQVSNMGTTAAMVRVDRHGVSICNVGDSRIYRYRDGNLELLSVDHVSLAAGGRKPPLIQYLGKNNDAISLKPHTARLSYRSGDLFLLCSDGLTDMISVCEIEQELSAPTLSNAGKTLLQKALQNGGRDNISMIMLRLK